MTDSLERLEKVASMQHEWSALDASIKEEMLQEMLDIFQGIGYVGFTQVSQDSVKNVMGIPLDTPEGRFETATQTLVMIAMIKGALEQYHYAYQVRAGMAKPHVLPTRTRSNGQVVVQVAPLTTQDKFGPFQKCVGQVYLDPKVVTNDTDVKTFDFEQFESKNEGVTLILGAGNQTFLTFVDTLHALFQTNRVAYVKHHPLRANLDGIFRRIFAPLIAKHYVDTEVDIGVEHSKVLVYSPRITHVHMTGGKDTHDAIVWGGASQQSLERQQPVLKASMTSELGCVTPWIIVPGHYTTQQLLHQASSIAKSVYLNASANCNAPKVLILSNQWPQREEFMSMVLEEWQSHVSPCTWYPGSKARWDRFRQEYPDAELLESLGGVDNDQRLETPLLGKDCPLALPLLSIRVTVDMSTEEGHQAAAKEYCFLTEPFAPVLTFATLSDDTFLESAVQLCNDYNYGSLSCSITVPIELEGSEEVESAISCLEYGSIAVNAWTGLAYAVMPLTWGAFPGETLNAVESGIGQVKNTYFIPNVQKSVLRTPLVDKIHGEMERDLDRSTREVEATARFLLAPGVGTFVKLLATTMGIYLLSWPDLWGRGHWKGESLVSYGSVVLIAVVIATGLYLNGKPFVL